MFTFEDLRIAYIPAVTIATFFGALHMLRQKELNAEDEVEPGIHVNAVTHKSEPKNSKQKLSLLKHLETIANIDELTRMFAKIKSARSGSELCRMTLYAMGYPINLQERHARLALHRHDDVRLGR